MLATMIHHYANVPNKYLAHKETTVCGRKVMCLKYTKKAYYDNMFADYPMLNQARGHVFDAMTGEILVRPFDRLEHSTTEDGPYTIVEKINGFLGHATITKDGTWLIGTTGTITGISGEGAASNDYVEMFRDKLTPAIVRTIEESGGGFTYLFEVVDVNDPHIVIETPGLYLIGARQVSTGFVIDELALDEVAKRMRIRRPRWHSGITKEELSFRIASSLLEGYVVRSDKPLWEPLFKAKTNWYTAAKILARGKEARMEVAVNLAPIFGLRIEKVGKEAFYAMPEEERLKVLGVR